MKDKWIEKIIVAEEKIDFVPMTQEYGRAEFIFCPVYKYGKMKELYIYPKQQPDAKFYYKFELKYTPLDFSISSWAHQGMDDPNIWLMFWCKEHKCMSFSVYVPIQAKSFHISTYSNLRVQFEK